MAERADDLELARRCREGDAAAFETLYRAHAGRLFGLLTRMAGSAQDAEDLTARVFFRAMGHIESYTDRGVPFQAWLYRIAHNLTANWHRDQGRRKVVSLEDYIASELIGDAPDRAVMKLHRDAAEGHLTAIADADTIEFDGHRRGYVTGGGNVRGHALPDPCQAERTSLLAQRCDDVADMDIQRQAKRFGAGAQIVA